MKKHLSVTLILIALSITCAVELPAKKIDLYGYSNFLFTYSSNGNREDTFLFSQNRTNLLVSSEFFKRWDFFVNVEFTGAFKIQSNPVFSLEDGKPTYTHETETTGRLELEEAWTRFTASEEFKIKVGQFHAPFGSFNVIQDAAPTYISVRPPLIYDDSVRDQNPVSIIPDKANLELSGIFRHKGFALEYYLYAGSGAASEPQNYNMDNDISIGSRLLFNFDENIKLGFSSYFDTIYYDAIFIDTYIPDETILPASNYSEKRSSFSADVDISYGRFNLNAEYILNKNNNTTLGKFDRTFFYINLNAEILRKIKIYGEIDNYKDNSPAQGIRTWFGKGLNKFIGGINYKPNWVTAIKAEVEYNYFIGSDKDGDWRFLTSLSVIF